MTDSISEYIATPIPVMPEPDWPVVSRIPIQGTDEPLMPLSLAPHPVKVFPVYAKQGLPGAINECYVRESVYRRLLQVARALPSGMGLIILDGWRPWRVQQYLFDTLQETLRTHHPDLGEEELLTHTREFVSVPSRDLKAPSPHLTGGAVDVTLSDADGLPLNMGTLFDEAVPASHTAYYETLDSLSEHQHRARHNRRLLYGLMSDAGFSNLPSEWWHYDAGDQLWAHYGDHSQALYGPAEPETVESRWRRQL